MPLLRQDVPVFTSWRIPVLAGSFILAVLVCLAALSMGSADISPGEIVKLMAGRGDEFSSRIIMEIRLPRILSGFYVGGMLALAGCLMQVLLRNPLAEPYILGVSGGAAVFALSAILIGVSAITVNFMAFTGALFSIVLVFFLSRIGGEWTAMRTLLTGVVLAAGWGAIIGLLLTLSPAERTQGMLFWLMGDISFADYSTWNFFILGTALVVCLSLARALNLLAGGELNAASLGVPVQKLNYIVYFLASILTAAAVMQAGSIGFVGLIIPHMTRLMIGGDHRMLLPVSVLLGGSLLVMADALARTVLAPQQLPVGVVTAILGVPVFLLLLHTTYTRERA